MKHPRFLLPVDVGTRCIGIVAICFTVEDVFHGSTCNKYWEAKKNGLLKPVLSTW